MSPTILVVDDDPHIREIASFALTRAGMQAVHARDGAEALEHLKDGSHDLIVLDINMPELDGLEVCRQVRMTSAIPILFLSSRDEEVDRVVGLEMGGDDYLTKPFSPREMVARVKAILKRTRQPAPAAAAGEDAALRHGGLKLVPAQHLALFKEEPLQLTATEYEILKGFLQRPRHVLERDAIMGFAYDFNVHVSDRTIDSHIRHIRQKLADAGCQNAIETVHGVGYKLGSCQ